MNYVEDADKNRRLENDGLMFVPLIAVIQLSRTAAGLGAIPARWSNNACWLTSARLMRELNRSYSDLYIVIHIIYKVKMYIIIVTLK